MGKRLAPGGVANLPKSKMQKLVQPITDTECFFLTKLPQELRDQVYDNVAMADTRIGAYVTLNEDSSVELYAYSSKGLGHTCRQVRQEYSLRLEPRSKCLLAEFQKCITSKSVGDPRKTTLQKRLRRIPQPHMGPPMPALSHSAQSHLIQIAERRVVGGVYIQEDIAYTMRIPFGVIDDMGLRLSTLAVTLASSSPREYTDKYPLDPSRNEEALWTAKTRMETLAEAVIALHDLVSCTDRTEHDPWRELFWDFEILFPWIVVNTGDTDDELFKPETYKGRSDKDRWWKTLGNRFCYPACNERAIEEV
ncbi:hypothetical protein MBLNU13_g04893t2 [Cladosporium sp. NU13]